MLDILNVIRPLTGCVIHITSLDLPVSECTPGRWNLLAHMPVSRDLCFRFNGRHLVFSSSGSVGHYSHDSHWRQLDSENISLIVDIPILLFS